MFKKFYAGLITILLAIAVTITINYAWYVNGFDVDPLATGSSVDAYYHSGSGTSSDDPYIITSPRHLYNLAWLQYLGTYNGKKASNGKIPATYFKLGTTANGTLDMTGWPLPPIGTTENPFLGNFNGNGWKITNLTTTNTFSEFRNKHPSIVADASDFKQEKCSVIGFFGSIGSYNQSVLCETGYTATSYDTAANKVYNFYLNDNNVHTSFSTTLIGAVAGYVNATIEDVGVIQPHLNIQSTGATSITSKETSNLSDFAVVGYAEEEYTTEKTKSSTIIYNPTYSYSHFNFKGMGSQADWGGSMKMQELYERIVNINPSGSEPTTSYVNSELRYENIDKSSVTTTSTSNRKSVNLGDERGSYVKRYNNDTYNYMTSLYKDVIIVTKTDTVNAGFIISNNTNDVSAKRYLNIASENIDGTLEFDVSIDDSSASRTWLSDASNRLYTYNEDDGYPYYLVANNNLSLSVTNNASSASSWVWDETTYRTTISSTNYYLKYFDGEWTLKNTYVISDGNNHYIKYDETQTNNVGVSSTINDATSFMFSTDGNYPYGKIYTADRKYIRCDDGNLQITSTNTYNTWNNLNGKLYIEYDNINYYIQYDNVWGLVTNTYYIVFNGNYLYLDSNGQIQVNGTTSVSNATEFVISNALINGTGTGKIYANIGNQKYYLRFTNYSSFTTTMNKNDSNTTWSYDGSGFYQTNNSINYYIQYNNGWGIIEWMPYFYISYNSHYISLSGTTVGDTTNISDATVWQFSNYTNITYPSGYITTKIDNTTYYLSSPSVSEGYVNYLTVNTTDQHLFSNNNGYLKDDSTNCYVIYYELDGYDNNWWTYAEEDTALTFLMQYNVKNFGIFSLASQPDGLSLTVKDKVNRTDGTSNIYQRSGVTVEPSLFTYMPLNASSTADYEVDSSNTGYIISGAHSASPYEDIRVSKYPASSVCNSVDYYVTNNNGHYLSLNGSKISDSTNKDTTVRWHIKYISGVSNSNNINAYIYSANTSTTYYLRYNNGLTTTTSQNSATSFVVADTNISYTSNNRTYYLKYSSGWVTTSGSSNTYLYVSNFSNVKTIENSNNQKVIKTIDDEYASNLKKYASSSSQLLETLGLSYYEYGLHFMNADISIDRLATLPSAIINGTLKTKYKMPEDSIDFQLASKGYINFFAGSYFSGNNAFFSLHQIIRDSNDNITSIKHITQIYSANSSYGSGWQSQDNIYIYSDGTSSGTIDSRYTLSFDYSWIENPGSQSSLGYRDLYYFEIPVNKGEYALGSVSNKTGAYLIYLDIGANAAPVDRTEISQKTTTTNDTLKYVNGIQILASGSTYTSDANSAVATITTANVTAAAGNDIVISRSINTITFSTSLISTYKDEGITLSGGTVTPVATSTTIQNVLRYVDYNRATDKLYYTTIYNNGTSNISYDCYTVNKTTGEKATQITATGDAAEWGLLVIDANGSGVPTALANFTNIKDRSYGTTKILDFYSYILTSDLASLTETVDMKVKEDTTSSKPVQTDYTFEHIYELAGDSITMAPNGLVVYIGPDLKATATVSGVTDHVATVTISGTTYTFTFNASTIDNTAKTVTIYYVAPETP